MSATPQHCCRIGFVIRNMGSAVLHWVQTHHGSGPWMFMDEVTQQNYLRGQTTFFVDDLSSAMTHWSEKQDVGPWFHVPEIAPDAASYRGTPVSLSFSKAYANSRDSQEMTIELVQITATGKTVFDELFDEVVHPPLLGAPADLPPGTRNVSATSCWYTTSGSTIAAKKQKLIEHGYAIVHEARRMSPNEVVIYAEHPGVPGLMLEVAETTSDKKAQLEAITSAGRQWDGKDPVRQIQGAATIS